MNSSTTTYRRPGAFSPRPSSPALFRGQSYGDPSESDSSSSSQVTAPSRDQQSPQRQPNNPSPQPQYARPSIYPSPNSNASTNSINNFSRPHFHRQVSSPTETPTRQHFGQESKGHRRQHSQGFFEPSLPTATLSDQSVMANLTASQIAAQAAMQHQSTQQHTRQRSQTIPSPRPSPPGTLSGRKKPPPIQTAAPHDTRKISGTQTPGRQNYNGAIGGHAAAATTAANAAFPRSPLDVPEKEHKLKTERSKMKLFSKPKTNKDAEKDRPLPSPNKIGPAGLSGLSKMVNPSMNSLGDSLTSGGASLYSMNTGNTSTSTLVPADRQAEKEKAHKHHFLSRQKNKLKDKIGDDHILPLSSASSNSKPLDPSAPSSLYSFAPAPSSPATSSFSGLDLRHGGRALREKKKEEKSIPFAPKRSDIDRTDWIPTLGAATHAPSLFGNSSYAADIPTAAALQGFGLHNMRPEDAWDFLKAKLLTVFEQGEELRIPIEDLNRLVTVHVQRCILKRIPTLIVDDLRSLFQTGFISLDQTLIRIPDSRLVPHLVEMWLFVFGTVLPYMQAVFLPLDQEFKGHGSMTPSEALDFWGANPDSADGDAFGNEFDVRRIVLLSYRDNVILPHYEALKATFSRLSLDSINVTASPTVSTFDTLTSSSATNTNTSTSTSNRPGTSGSLDPGVASFNSQGSTLLDSSTSGGGRSRAASNLSAPELPSFTSTHSGSSPHRRGGGTTTATTAGGAAGAAHPPLPTARQDSSQIVTETVGRMLQCVTVLASTQSGDEGQAKMEDLAGALKLNWLGRGRTGRNRRGFVGARVGVKERGRGAML